MPATEMPKSYVIRTTPSIHTIIPIQKPDNSTALLSSTYVRSSIIPDPPRPFHTWPKGQPALLHDPFRRETGPQGFVCSFLHTQTGSPFYYGTCRVNGSSGFHLRVELGTGFVDSASIRQIFWISRFSSYWSVPC